MLFVSPLLCLFDSYNFTLGLMLERALTVLHKDQNIKNARQTLRPRHDAALFFYFSSSLFRFDQLYRSFSISYTEIAFFLVRAKRAAFKNAEVGKISCVSSLSCVTSSGERFHCSLKLWNRSFWMKPVNFVSKQYLTLDRVT